MNAVQREPSEGSIIQVEIQYFCQYLSLALPNSNNSDEAVETLRGVGG